MTALPVQQETRPHYAKAPILEAIIDFRVASGVAPSLEALGSIDWGGDYPERATVEEGEFRLGGPERAAVSTKPIGYRFASSDGTRIVQARASGFTFSRLPQYESWEPFCDEARQLWSRYIAVRKPELVTRIAVRYINRLELPLPIADFKDYLRNAPDVSSALPQGLSGFVLQLKIPQLDLPDGMLVLNEGILPSPNPQVAPILLDIDIFHAAQAKPESSSLWDALEVLHKRKNDVFEASITDKTRELIR